MRKLGWLVGKRAPHSTYNKLLIYNQIFKPVWTYGIQLWGCAKQKHINLIQQFQNKYLRSALNVPWYVRNSDLHRDYHIKTVGETIQQYAAAHEKRLQVHVNPEASKLCNTVRLTRLLKRSKPHDLMILNQTKR